MAENTSIEWADDSISGWWGCHKIAPGCASCYAKDISDRFGGDVWGKGKPRLVIESAAASLRRLNRRAAKEGRARLVFVNSMSDFFEDHDGPVVNREGRRLYVGADGNYWPDPLGGSRRPLTLADLRAAMFGVFDECQHLRFLLLTKRPENIRRMWAATPRPPAKMVDAAWEGKADANRYALHRPNVWLLTSIAVQADADRNIPHLLACRDLAPVLGVSAEPLLGPLEFSDVSRRADAVKVLGQRALSGINWIVVGGESGSSARPCDVAWVRCIVGQCKAAGVAVFCKQLGSHVVTDGCTHPGEHWPDGVRQQDCAGHWRILLKDKKGGNIQEFPPDLRVREWPEGATP